MKKIPSQQSYAGANILRFYGHVLSDEHMKELHEITDLEDLANEIMSRGGPFNEREIEVLTKHVGNMDSDHDFEKDGHRWNDDILSKYADYVQNYKYTYKDEATEVDPSIDTVQEHIGPMAQDLEKVNPAVVAEDPKTGYKTVDTGRLALMNAGAIADLAREVQELKHVAG